MPPRRSLTPPDHPDRRPRHGLHPPRRARPSLPARNDSRRRTHPRNRRLESRPARPSRPPPARRSSRPHRNHRRRRPARRQKRIARKIRRHPPRRRQLPRRLHRRRQRASLLRLRPRCRPRLSDPRRRTRPLVRPRRPPIYSPPPRRKFHRPHRTRPQPRQQRPPPHHLPRPKIPVVVFLIRPATSARSVSCALSRRQNTQPIPRRAHHEKSSRLVRKDSANPATEIEPTESRGVSREQIATDRKNPDPA